MAYRRIEIPLAITIIIALLTVLLYYFSIPQLDPILTAIQASAADIFAYSIFVGLINLSLRHGRNIQKRLSGQWYYSIWYFVVMVITFVAGILPPLTNHPAMNWIVENVIQYLNSALVSIIVFSFATAMFRSFRIRTLESSVLVISILISLLTMVPIGEALWPGFGVAGRWLREVIMNAGMRVFAIMIGLGAITLAVRVIMGRERGYLREESI